MSKGIDIELLSTNIKRFIEVQYGEDVDECMEFYINVMIKETLEGKVY